MYCCCDCKIMSDDDWMERCSCEWKGWISVYDWPPPRKNKDLPFALPADEGKYYTRYQNGAGDHYEEVQEYKKNPRESKCGYTGKKVWLHWSGNDEKQPYAWRNLKESET